jgi:tetratricopeptide (TPR) repeat protein
MADEFQELFANGYRARREGRFPESRALFLDAVRKAAEHYNRSALAEAFCGLAQAERDIGNCAAAHHHYANAALLYRQIGPPAELAFALRHEADLARELHRAAEAEPLYREAETIYRGIGSAACLDLANTLRGLALSLEQTGSAQTSRPLWFEARDLYARCDVKAGVAECDRKLEQAGGA